MEEKYQAVIDYFYKSNISHYEGTTRNLCALIGMVSGLQICERELKEILLSGSTCDKKKFHYFETGNSNSIIVEVLL